jgi:hypothetical protein
MNYQDVMATFRMSRKNILFYFTEMDAILRETGDALKLWVCGGANMCLYVKVRESTHDIDTYPSDEGLLWAVVEKMRQKYNLPNGWLNPSGTIFVTEQMRDEAVLGLDFPNLKVYFLAYEAMLVLKVLAGRGGDFPDLNDAAALIKKLGITDIAAVDALIKKYNPTWNNAFVLKFAGEALMLSKNSGAVGEGGFV